MLKTVAVLAECVAVSMDTAGQPLLTAGRAVRAVPVTVQEEDLRVPGEEAWGA
uniref:Uncharacterized protein n=1 Tax=Picea sitchensis TaxID=3332 RepID=A9NKK3_PICSI|nr:unknown [Picea sitchensis]